ncbi:uncharacterized protein J4E87_009964 [Alternaria ethzedia]|uniref:uncharacterized protein n=1 Tax=Alternaria ethzedia TaxID=181014 RepID=UPI0020C2371C|nr:uncharacterized protein J4E87_009964 [Alternaria ethzedia]KAI4613317.1 hypothetical protein J4E87_009964 [Alternaria ethzedia]
MRYHHVRRALDLFTIPRQGGDHRCLVQKPMWDSFKDLLNRNPTHRFTDELLRAGLSQMFLALDYLHTEAKVIHTDIKADNILIEIEDQDILKAFVDAELTLPSPRKVVEGKPIYATRQFGIPKEYGRIHDAQPDVYRCPEVMLKTEWGFPADIWNVGAMIWDLYEDKHLFHGIDPTKKRYLTRAPHIESQNRRQSTTNCILVIVGKNIYTKKCYHCWGIEPYRTKETVNS